MTRSPKESKAIRDNLAGQNVAAASVPIPELIAITGRDVRSRFAAFENDDQRNGFLEAITQKLDSNWGNWAKFYEAVSILREHKAFWKNKGFDTFESFWQSKAGPAFKSFKELEDIYSFAKTACPELFGIDFEGAKRLRQQLERLRSIPALNQNGGAVAKKRHYAGTAEAHAAVVQAMTWHNAGGTSLEYRLAKLKRDRPDIAARVLAGEFFKTLGTGQIGIDMASAEREAYGEKPSKKRVPSKKGNGIVSMIRSNAKSKASREQIIQELLQISWLVDGLAKSKRK